ncbi:alpha-L-arabinofuranosidase C-terminal domain-containing protein [Paraflavisolibacter sp. H34]|uniref:alpha-L-arabinofuranosidase C-terminal domain-containing protein n=1 Tax=Huijunlia imazamoxiresistens TaxID=3127457 RepID=UPI003019799D
MNRTHVAGGRKRLIAALWAALACFNAAGQKDVLTVKAGEIKAPIPATLWGVFFEDINFGADGGIYAELVKNRSFEFLKPLMGWTVQRKKAQEGDVLLLNRQDQHAANPRFLRVRGRGGEKGTLGLTNEGFRGMGIKQGMRYDFSVMYRQQVPGLKLHVELVDAKGMPIGDTVLTPFATDKQWHKQAVSFHAAATEPKAKLNIWFEGQGTIDLDMISLFPGDTWKNRPGGLRADMVRLLADMKPGFVRFPGGCIVEGFDLANRYQWKNTVGPVEDRPLLMNRWNTEFGHRPAPDYFQTFGLGFYEYFQLCEDIGAEPLPILNCGMACQYNTAEVVPLDQLDPYVQDALDLVEFANGPVSGKWGALRAQMGHPAPFNLKMMGVGNENWGPQYLERLDVFTRALKEKYPGIKLVNSSGTDPDGARFHLLNDELRKRNADLIDEHYYRKPEWFLANAGRYDNYPRNGSKVFAGEYAAHGPAKANNWQSALAEAAFMTGLERNADVVQMASYAPLFAHAEGWQWNPDLIWVDNLRTAPTTDYYVQKLFSLNKGTHVVPATMNGAPLAGQDSLYATASIDGTSRELIIKLVNASGLEQKKDIIVQGAGRLAAKAKLLLLQQDDLKTTNSLDHPSALIPVEKSVSLKGNRMAFSLAPYSLNILRIKIEGK